MRVRGGAAVKLAELGCQASPLRASAAPSRVLYRCHPIEGWGWQGFHPSEGVRRDLGSLMAPRANVTLAGSVEPALRVPPLPSQASKGHRGKGVTAIDMSGGAQGWAAAGGHRHLRRRYAIDGFSITIIALSRFSCCYLVDREFHD